MKNSQTKNSCREPILEKVGNRQIPWKIFKKYKITFQTLFKEPPLPFFIEYILFVFLLGILQDCIIEKVRAGASTCETEVETFATSIIVLLHLIALPTYGQRTPTSDHVNVYIVIFSTEFFNIFD